MSSQIIYLLYILVLSFHLKICFTETHLDGFVFLSLFTLEFYCGITIFMCYDISAY